MGAALTYARRYALFALVGIAGEDDLDAPDLPGPSIQPSGDPAPERAGNRRRTVRSISQPIPVLADEPSAALRDQLVAEIGEPHGR